MFLETHTLPKAVKKLLIINIGIHVFLLVSSLHSWAVNWFGLIPLEVIQHAQLWRLGTYLFLHANIFWHLIFNMFAIWMFGPEVERRLGAPKFIFYYFLTGIGGALCSVLINSNSIGVTIGASGSIFGLLVAFAVLFPDAVITMIFPPISVKAKHFAIAFGAIQLLLIFEGTSKISWAIQVGGMCVGYIYLKYMLFSNKYLNWRIIKEKIFEKRKKKREQFIKEELDPILDKISRVGIGGLTGKEKKILKQAHYRI